MKVGVLTFHRCINYGSYWQARCLVEGLQGMGHDAELLDHDCVQIRQAEWRCALNPQLPVPTRRDDLRRYSSKTRKFLTAFDRLSQSARFSLHEPEQAGEYDAVVIGSDEVWNFRHPWYGYKPIFFGERLRTGRLISYAASFGNHDAAEGIETGWADKLRRFDSLSVRDENSRMIVRGALGTEAPLVLDPCLQFPPRPRSTVDLSENRRGPYLAVYGHGFPDGFADAVGAWARSAGLRILSIGYHNPWADEQLIEAGPEEFSDLMAGASAVATNFFHGCVFALHHNRPFVCATSPYRQNKVRDLMNLLEAREHMVGDDTSADVFARLLGTPLAPVIAERIAAMRIPSHQFLAAALA